MAIGGNLVAAGTRHARVDPATPWPRRDIFRSWSVVVSIRSLGPAHPANLTNRRTGLPVHGRGSPLPPAPPSGLGTAGSARGRPGHTRSKHCGQGRFGVRGGNTAGGFADQMPGRVGRTVRVRGSPAPQAPRRRRRVSQRFLTHEIGRAGSDIRRVSGRPQVGEPSLHGAPGRPARVKAEIERLVAAPQQLRGRPSLAVLARGGAHKRPEGMLGAPEGLAVEREQARRRGRRSTRLEPGRPVESSCTSWPARREAGPDGP